MTSHDPLQPHSHDNNELPPNADTTIQLALPDGSQQRLTLDTLQTYPKTTYDYQYHTDHGVHGPYALAGVSLRDFVGLVWSEAWQQAEVISADGFGNRISAEEVLTSQGSPILLCYASDGVPLERKHGLVRLVVPSETHNALRQVKWVAEIRIL